MLRVLSDPEHSLGLVFAYLFPFTQHCIPADTAPAETPNPTVLATAQHLLSIPPLGVHSAFLLKGVLATTGTSSQTPSDREGVT